MQIRPVAFHLSAPPGSRASVTQGPAEPVDSLRLEGRAEEAERPPARSWAKVGMLAGLAVAGIAGVAGLTHNSPPPPPTSSQSAPAAAGNQAAAALERQSQQGSMEFQVVPEGLGRVPLIRETDKDPGADEQQNMSYSPLGVHLGDGIFHDLHGNLVLVPALAFQEPFVPDHATSIKVENKWTAGYTVSAQGDGLLVDGTADQTITRQGGTVKVDGPLGADFVVSESKDRVRVDGPMFEDYDITRQGDTIRSDGPGKDDYTITRQGDTLFVDGPGEHDLTIRRQANQITVQGPGGRETRITREGDRIAVEGSGPNFTLQREGDAIKMDASWMRGSRTEYGR